MKKQILSLGKFLDKTEQKLVRAGGDAIGFCDGNGDCPSGSYCDNYFCIKEPSSGNGSGGSGSGGGCIPDRFCLNEYDTCCIG